MSDSLLSRLFGRTKLCAGVFWALLLLGFAIHKGSAQTENWTSQDIGAPTLSGSTTYDSATDTFTIQGAGTDVWGTSDQFQYAYCAISGDCEIVARVASLGNTDPWAKAGVMIRETLSGDSKEVFMAVTLGHGLAGQWRSATGGNSTTFAAGAGTVPVWVKLKRFGNQITLYRSTDGQLWAQVTSQTISMNATAYAGLAVCSHNVSALTTATFDHVGLTAGGSGTLQSPWNHIDIGNTGYQGDATFDGLDTFTLRGGGADIWGTADAFQFLYQPLVGDGAVQGRVASETNVNGWAKAGSMIRETLNANSAHGMAMVSPSNGLVFQGRTTTGSGSFGQPGLGGQAPVWTKVERRGEMIIGWKSDDGATWDWLGSQRIPMTAQVYAGMIVTAHDNTKLGEATFDSVQVIPGRENPLPAPWNEKLIGTPGFGGWVSYANSAFQLFSGAGDAWSTADQGEFVYQALNGDGAVALRVDSLLNSNPWAKVGVMMRESLDVNAKNIFWAVTPSNGVIVQKRIATGGATTSYYDSVTKAPVWLKIERMGNMFVALKSADGVTWSVYGTETVPMAASIYAGALLCSPSTTTIGQGKITGMTLGAATDVDGNGLPDLWEQRYFGTTGNNPQADYDGDGLSNLVEYQQGSDPTNFYSQNSTPLVPVLGIVSGDAQTVFDGIWLHDDLVVSVIDSSTGQPIPNAPVTFVVSKGDAELASTRSGTTGSTLSLVTDASGIARAALTMNDDVAAKVTVTTRGASTNVTFTEGTHWALGRWNFETGDTASITDVSGNGKTATAVGTLTTSQGIEGTEALSFDGASYLQTQVPGQATATLMAWIRPTSSPDVAQIQSVFDCDVAGQYGTGWGLDDGKIKVILDNQFWDTGVPVVLNTWQHVALVYDATTAKVYVNGVLRASLSYPRGSVTTANYRIGRSNANALYFNGDIDDARIYGSAFTDADFAFLDRDGDGMLDKWELQKFGTLDRQGDEDSDFDGISNRQEQLDNTDPLDPGSVLPKRIAYFPFDDGAFTSNEGQTPNAVGEGYVAAEHVSGIKGNAARINQANQILAYGWRRSDGSPNYAFRRGTVRLWFRPLGWGTPEMNGRWARLYELGVWTEDFSQPHIVANFHADQPVFIAVDYNGANRGALRELWSNPVDFGDGTWHQFALTYSEAGQKIYLDGQLVGNGSTPFEANPSMPEILAWGLKFGNDFGSYLGGDIDEAEFFNYELTPQEIARQYQTGDNDRDGMSDSWEIKIADANGSDNLNSIDDVLPDGDFDHDGLTNLQEYQRGSDPINSDSDFDGISDKQELVDGTNPLDPESVLQKRIAYFPFDEASFISNEGQLPSTVSGMAEAISVAGMKRGAMHVDQMSQLLRYEWMRSDGSPNYCIRRGTTRMWFKLDWTPEVGAVNDYKSCLFDLGMFGHSDNSLDIFYDNPLFEFFSKDDTGHTYRTVSAFSGVSAGQWHQVAVTYSSTSEKIYLDGAFLTQRNVSVNGQTVDPQSSVNWNSTPNIGDFFQGGFKFGSDGSQPLRGDIDEAEFFNYELTPEDIQTQYTTAKDAFDKDHDDLPDQWEIANFGMIDHRPGQDDDHDGKTNFQEWLDGTNPNDPLGPEVSGVWLYEYYDNISGSTLADLRNAPAYPGQPSGRAFVASANTPQNRADHFGARLRGYVIVPETGTYKFAISGDDQAELWISTTGSPANLQRVANVSQWTDFQQWNKHPEQQSATMELTAGQKLYVEVVQMEIDGGDHASVGWVLPGKTDPTPLTPSALAGEADPQINNDGDTLPDYWEILNFGTTDHRPDQDDDRDGKTNYQEWQEGTNPNDPLGPEVSGAWIYEYYSNITGSTLANLRNAPAYPGQPSGRMFVATADTPQNRGDNFGSRLRGSILIPETGSYKFAVSGDDETELWLSTTGQAAQLQRIARVPAFTNYQQWNKTSDQLSAAVLLTAGQKVYVEVLEKESTGGDHASVGWVLPGDTAPTPILRELMLGEGDTSINNDGDTLPDSWEISKFGNLDQAPNADPDGDGISNQDEYQAGSDPTDFFNGVEPVLEIVSGNGQSGSPNAFLADPLRIRLLTSDSQPYANAPVTFEVASGDTTIASAGTSAPLTTKISVRTDANGYAEVRMFQASSPVGAVLATAGKQSLLFSESINMLAVDLVGAWNFQEASGVFTADDSGNNLSGTLIGGAAFLSDGPVGGRSVIGNGGDSRVRVDENPLLNLNGTALSIALWLKPMAIGTQQTLVAKSENAAYRLFLKSDGSICLSLARADGTTAVATSPFTLPEAAWSHVGVTVTMSGTQGSATFYLNGVSQGSVTLDGINQIRAATGPLILGALGDSQTEVYSGNLDDVRIYNRELAAADVVSLFKNGKPSSGLTGLIGAYYRGVGFDQLGERRLDSWINFNWGLFTPSSFVPPDGFSVRWTGFIKPRYSETYTFRTVSDDGVRLWINDQQIINDWNLHTAKANTGTITLQADQLYDIRIEYFDATNAPGDASMQLFWSSAHQALEIVPSSRLFPWDASETWKQRIVDANPNDSITSISQVSPGDDFDNDGLPNFEELRLGTDPTRKDTDNDGLSDGQEAGAEWPLATGTDPTKADTDGDGRQDYADFCAVTVSLYQGAWHDANWIFNPNFYDPENHTLSLYLEDNAHPDQFVFNNLIDSTNYRGYGADHGIWTNRNIYVKRGSSLVLKLKSANPHYDPMLLPLRPRKKPRTWAWHTDIYALNVWKQGTTPPPGDIKSFPGFALIDYPHPHVYPPLRHEWGNNASRLTYNNSYGSTWAARDDWASLPYGVGIPGTSSGTSSSSGSSLPLVLLNPYDVAPSTPSPYQGLYVADLTPYSWLFSVASDPDSDGDGLSDGQEKEVFHTNPHSTDSDGDGMPDVWEVANRLNPIGNDAYDDADGDGWPNIYELKHGTKVSVAGQDADPNNIVAKRPPVYTVDPLHGADSQTDAIFSTIQEAVNEVQRNTGTASQPIYPNRYAVVQVKSGTYSENISTGPAEMLIIGERGVAPVTIKARTGDAIRIAGPSVWENFVITHDSGYKGHGVNVSTDGWTRLINCIIRNNRLTEGYGLGAGIYHNTNRGQLDLVHCTVVSNDASGEGNGLFTYGRTNLINSILWDTGAAAQEIAISTSGAPSVTVTASIVKGGQYGGFDEDPLLTGEGWLTSQSPARDRSGASVRVNYDLQGEARPVGAAVDLGADEWVNSNANNLPDWWEQKYFGDVLAADDGDDDRPNPDGIDNLHEYLNGTDPTVVSDTVVSGGPDSDGDGMPDAYENLNGLNASIDDAYEDKDGDRWPNIYEFKHGTRVDVAGQAPDTLNPIANPPLVCTVDPAHGADSSTDTIYSTLQEAISQVSGSDYAVINVKSGTYSGNIYTNGSNVLVLGELGAKPPVISGTSWNTLTLYGPSVWEGFIVTHQARTHGRGISVSSNERVRLINCIVRDNTLEDDYSEGAAIYQNSSEGLLELVHCTLTRNSAKASGNGVFTYGKLHLINSILWDAGDAPEEIAISDWGSPEVTLTATVVKGGQFNGIDQDPLLTREGWLTVGSPARDRVGVSTVVTRDIHNELRPTGATSDLGADEWKNSDSDNLPDWWELTYFGNHSSVDSGNGDIVGTDGLTNLQEYMQGTNPAVGDTDGDGLNDSDEMTTGTDPWVTDSDGDGMSDGYESSHQLDPLADDGLQDKDGDRYPNYFEYVAGTSASNASSKPAFVAGPASLARYFRVDPSAAGSSSTDNIYAKIQDAINAATQDGSIIEVKGGIYNESLWISQRRLLLLGELNTANGVAEVRGNNDTATLEMSTSSAVDGLTFTHKAGEKGGGVNLSGSGSAQELPFRRLSNCLILGNSSYSEAGVQANGVKLEILQSTIAANNSTWGGNGISLGYDASLKLESSIVWNEMGSAGEEVYSSGENPIEVISSIIHGGEQGAWDASASPVNRFGIPKPPGDFTPVGNPAVDRITTSNVKSPKDIFGAARPGGSAGDLGAVEYVDSDNDGVLDSWEIAHFGNLTRNLSTSNSDNDGLSDLDEYLGGTDPFNPDTDSDGVFDGLEINTYHTDPFNPDSDGDTLSDGLEINQLNSNAAMTDSDSDGMPDWWEYKYRSTPEKVGLNIIGWDATGDPDGDLQANIQEYRGNTDPLVPNPMSKRTDTDGDGLFDDEELNEFFTDPAARNNYSMQPASIIEGKDGTFVGPWVSEAGSAYLEAAQGNVSYGFTLPNNDIFIADVQWQIRFFNQRLDAFTLRISCDGMPLGYYLAKKYPSSQASQAEVEHLRVVLPFLSAGAHQLKIEVFGANTYPCFQIDQVAFNRLVDGGSGPLSTIMQGRLEALNGITTTAATSATSPLCLEGRGRFLHTIRVNGTATPLPALKDQWYLNVPLSESGATDIPVSFENGALQKSLQVEWVATNVLTSAETLTIRKGDSLKLVAAPNGVTSGAMTIRVGGQSFPGDVSSPIIRAFDAAGSFVVTGQFGSQSRNITVKVTEASFPEKALGVIGKARDWKCMGIPNDLPFDADADLFVKSQALSVAGTTFNVTPPSENLRHIVVRAFKDGPILAVGAIQGFHFFSWGDAGIEQTGVGPDGTLNVQMTVRISIPWETGMGIRIVVRKAGVTFDDGTIERSWTTADVQADGSIKILFILPPNVGGPCHGFTISQNGESLN